MQDNFLLFSVVLPLGAALLNWGLPRRIKGLVAFLVSFAALVASCGMFGKESTLKLFDIGFGIAFSFRLYHFSSFIVAAVSAFTFLTALFCLSFFTDKNTPRQFPTYLLLALGFTNGAVLSDNLVVMLFFWEGLLLLLFAMIAHSGSASAFKTAIKAFVIVGIADLCMMVGTALTGRLAGTLAISEIHLVPRGLAGIAFLLLVIGAIAKAGSMPYHSWIPDAAVSAPLPFMAYFPAALEKLLGIYFLSRICLDVFRLEGGSGLSLLLMSVGALTILLAVMMALVQKDYKRLLSYHAISQVGYMILGIGTALPIGIIGGLFHMVNNALYKSCLFFTAGAVERETGTTDLQELGGLYRKMPVTFICFLIAAVSISGVPPFNGFFSKELIYDAALERGPLFYIAALLGSFFTAASFLKLGHAAFLGTLGEKNRATKEAPLPMLMVMLVIAACCILFGVGNKMVLAKFFQPVVAPYLAGGHPLGAPVNVTLIGMTVLVLLAAVFHHRAGAKINGSGLKALDHIYHYPLLHRIYAWQEKRYFDPYEIGVKVTDIGAYVCSVFDRFLDWMYNGFVVGVAKGCSYALRWLHDGNYVSYIMGALVGAGAVLILMTH